MRSCPNWDNESDAFIVTSQANVWSIVTPLTRIDARYDNPAGTPDVLAFVETNREGRL